MVTTLTLGAVRCVYIHRDQVIKATVRKVAVKGVMLKKICLRAVFQTLLLWASHFTFDLPMLFTLGFEIIIAALPVCYFFLWRSKSICRMKVWIISSNVLNQLYRLGLWGVFFHALQALVTFPFILGVTKKVEISKKANKYKVCVHVPITYWFNSDSSLDRDIIMAILNEARGIDGKKIIVQQALAEGFGLKDRREVDNRMQRYRKSGRP